MLPSMPGQPGTPGTPGTPGKPSRTGKRIAAALAVILVLCIGAGAWLWHQLFALPDWYEQELAAEAFEPAVPGAPPQWIAVDDDDEPIPPEELALQEAEPVLELVPPPGESIARRPRRKAKAHELRGFHRRRARGKAGESAVRASRARYENGRLHAGVVLDLSKIPKDKLSPKDRGLYDRAVASFPGLTRRDVYVGIEDRPITRDGFLQLGADPEVRVGNLRYPLAKAAAKLGMPAAQMRRELDLELRRLGLVAPQ